MTWHLVPRDWERWVEFTDGGSLLNLTGLSNDLALEAVRVEIRKGRTLKNTYHLVRRGDAARVQVQRVG